MLTERAVEYISKRGKGAGAANPFYLSLHYTAPHWPWEGPHDQEVSRTLGRGYGGFTAGGWLKTYAAMMRSLDDGIGEVLRAVDRAGMTQESIPKLLRDHQAADAAVHDANADAAEVFMQNVGTMAR